MNRLTEKFMDKVVLPNIPMKIKNKKDLEEYHEVRRDIENKIIKLAAYEDTELTPEEFIDLQVCLEDEGDVGGTIRDLIELMQYRKLEEQGLLIKLPCKVGETVYVLRPDVQIIEIGKVYCFAKHKDSLMMKILMDEQRITVVNINELGHIVFLTQEEAEKALKEI
jgi:hypothetical protein